MNFIAFEAVKPGWRRYAGFLDDCGRWIVACADACAGACAAAGRGRSGRRQPVPGSLEGAASGVLLHGPHGTLVLPPLARQAAPTPLALGRAPRFAGCSAGIR